MQADQQQQVRLARRPQGKPQLRDFQLADVDVPSPAGGEMLIQTLYLSVDPGMRGMMAGDTSYSAGFEVGQPLTGRSVGRVVSSKNPRFAVGDYVYERLPWQHYSLSDGRRAKKVDPVVAPLSTYLGVVGVPGFCAYFGLMEIGKPRAGQTVVVSGASGAVGMTAAQLAQLEGCRVVGVAGGSKKVRYLRDEIGLDAVVDYKRAGDLTDALREACPDGIDVYFDNVGGPITQAALALINRHARIVVCGQTSQYNNLSDSGKVAPEWLIGRSALMQGFVVYDYADRNDEAIARLSQLVRQGRLRYRENIVDGLQNAPQAFIDLFEGKSFGKQLVRLTKGDGGN
ncbi:MAG: NADP-dependent oxidoreductase [Rhodanobacteraceae bacterium]|nr:MAG: NADP-dependent oxidoreductase [Rhodanobacteraceae bacterium]